MKIGRNDLCPCGSGKKYKKCCLNKPPQIQSLDTYKQNERPEPHIDFCKSIIHQGYRFRAFGNKIHYRPIKETFHEFIIYNLMSTFSQNWYDTQKSLSKEKQHVLYKWYQSYKVWKKINATEANKVPGGWRFLPTGEVQALISFAYDAYCLQAFLLFPKFLVERLRDFTSFQSAHYEVLVAAVMKRAGYDIEFLDPKIKNKKHCEFIATNKYSKLQIGVEAKSRRRPGILNEKGEIKEDTLLKGDFEGLLLKAIQQKPEKIPYFIFIDMNIIPFDDSNPFEKPWFDDVKKTFDKLGKPTLQKPCPFNALFLTNFTYYLCGNTGITPRGYHITSIPLYSEVPLINFKDIHDVFTNPHITEVVQSLNRYNNIPKEI